jgi:hypothetical protein
MSEEVSLLASLFAHAAECSAGKSMGRDDSRPVMKERQISLLHNRLNPECPSIRLTFTSRLKVFHLKESFGCSALEMAQANCYPL